MLRVVVALSIALALTACSVTSCFVPTDVTGCPLEPNEAIGVPCDSEGTQCGEFSLCDPCTTDLSDCEMIVCEDGAWAAFDVDDTCDAGG